MSEAEKKKTTAERMADARAVKDRLETSRAEQAKLRALEVLELEVKHEAEIGPRGSQFEIVETIEGPIVVRLGEGILYTRFTASKVSPADIHDFVYPCVVHPAQAVYAELVMRRPDVASRCAHALMTLFGAKHKDDSGKF